MYRVIKKLLREAGHCFLRFGQNDQAREEAVLSLEAAPNYRPAQRLLLEVSGDGKN